MFYNSRGGDAFSWGSLLVRCGDGDGDGDVDGDVCGDEDACTVLSYAVHSEGEKRTASRFHVGDRLSSAFVEKDIYIHTRASSSRINIARKIRISYYKHNPAIKPHRSHRLAPHCPSPPASPLPYSSASLSLTTLSAHWIRKATQGVGSPRGWDMERRLYLMSDWEEGHLKRWESWVEWGSRLAGRRP